jgi:hypothetical protein
MYTAHFAAGLAIKSRAPAAPAWALITAAFLPDFFWISFALTGIEPTSPPQAFFDDWSHSALMILVWSSLFAAVFWKRGWKVMLPIWAAGLSHLLLDFLIHPARLALFPHSTIHLGWNLWTFGERRFWFGANIYWWIELSFIIPLAIVYIYGARKHGFAANLIAASCVALAALHLMALL